MEISLTTGNIVFVLGILGTIFTVYNYFRTPQIRSEKIDALLKQNLEFLTANFNVKFLSIDKQMINLKDNHIHTIETRIESLTGIISAMGNQLVELKTIINERIPHK